MAATEDVLRSPGPFWNLLYMSDSPAGLMPLLGEVIGTFALVFASCGAIVIDDTLPGAVGHLGIALAFGLVVMAMIYALGDVSGVHLNPAVTAAFFAAGRLPGRRVLPYVAAQCFGAFATACSEQAAARSGARASAPEPRTTHAPI